jgi:molybdopterin/thiamine biosynthesis adenylyltransferase/rhodanese-related sulfurtransferase
MKSPAASRPGRRDADPDAPLELSPREAWARVRAGVPLLDVRGEGERAAGTAEGARAVALDALLAHPAAALPDPAQEVGLLCASGQRTARAAARLRELGHARAWSVAGGLARWRAEALPVTTADESPDFLERFGRHLLLPEVGLDGQRRLRDARVVLVGAGGLGSPVALYLAAAGVGHLTLVDDDRVERSNLQRQVLHGEADVGRPKVASAADRLAALWPGIGLRQEAVRLGPDNADVLLAGHDAVVDGADNFLTRYLLSDACVRLGLPLVHGAVDRFRGQVALFWPAHQPEAGCYRCLFPAPPPAELVPNCAQAGVLGVLPGLVGMLQATETLKLLLGIGQPLLGTLLCVDALEMRFDRIGLRRHRDCPACGEGRPSEANAPTPGAACGAGAA